MRLRGLFFGVLGGIVLTGLLAYPMYIYVPSQFIPYWFHPRANVLWICIGLSAAVLFLTGLAGGRWSGLDESQTYLGGAAAGGIAAIIAFGIIICPAAGVAGNQSIFRYGLVKVPDEISLSWLVLYGVTETVWWGAVGALCSILIGVVLGAIGGWFAEPKIDERGQWPKLFPFVDLPMLMVSLVNFIITYTAYHSLLDVTMKTVTKTNFHGRFPVAFSFLLMGILCYSWVLFWQVKLWLDLRYVQKAYGVHTLSWALSSLIAVLFSVLFLLIGLLVLGANSFILIVSLISGVIGVLTFRDALWTKRHLPMWPIQNPFSDFGLAIRGGFMLSLFVTATLMMGNLGTLLNLVEITVSAIGPLAGNSVDQSAFWLATNVYLLPFSFFPTIFIVNFLYLILLLWTLKNIYLFLSEYALRPFGKLSDKGE